MDQIILDGKALSKRINARISEQIANAVNGGKREPCLALVLFGEDAASDGYVRMKARACQRVGILAKEYRLPEDTTTEEAVALIEQLNVDTVTDGIMIQHPLPAQLDERRITDTIAISKDVDGLNSATFGAAAMGEKAFYSASPMAIVNLLDEYGVTIEGKHAVIIGRSAILGRPLSFLLLNRNATVTICHSKTVNLLEHTQRADILICGVNKSNFVSPDFIKTGAVVVDAGYDDSGEGDCQKAVYAKASAYTPVPGGVGPMIITSLLKQTAEAYFRNVNPCESGL
ncbi:MAG: bifunctional 5,10-methylenetetrahydrofolate dehydrogenase/5,10-methenyltetrahydrofolate cyclohydrolase [Clostridia bacterium]|nr:bifunctional 5,10-methylenetetrahydrofolate dehydrogenase/5,10-methenyltetrahydrofolate cyclohydrolase [Clostridia bacterium]